MTMDIGFYQSPAKPKNHTKIKNKNPARLNFSGNFTARCKDFHVSLPERRASMKQDILEAVAKKTEALIAQDSAPMYEDPKDVIGKKPPKPPRKRTVPVPTSLPKGSDARSLVREQKRKLTMKYEGLITTLIERCEENVLVISEKENQITRLKEKLKTVLEYNKLFSQENDQLKSQYNTLVQYIEECKKVIKDEREKNRELEESNRELEEKMRKFEVPDRDESCAPHTVPLVEVCMSCSSRQVSLERAHRLARTLQRDMAAMKELLYRLNVQLSRYQERLRASIPNMADCGLGGGEGGTAPAPSATQGVEEVLSKTTTENQSHATTFVDTSGLLSAQALAPLFDAYQENIQEKDNLILDYEKQFEAMNKKSKQIVEDNKALSSKVSALEAELEQARRAYKKLVVEKETGDIEKATLLERVERAELKLKEVYELYEDKMAAMMRDYETVHREYFAVKSALEATESKMAVVDAVRARTVPADMHERRLDHCKRLLEELKHQYSMESERKVQQIAKLEQELKVAEEKCAKMKMECDRMGEELKTALKNVKLYRKAAVIFRARAQAAAARANKVKRARSVHTHSQRSANGESLRQALLSLERIKAEIREVKSRAHTSLEELERRIVEQEERAEAAHTQYRRELQRARAALREKEDVICTLMEAQRQAQASRKDQSHLQSQQNAAVTDCVRSPQEGASVKLVPTAGGYYQDKDLVKKKAKS